jgi:hypothetical protein
LKPATSIERWVAIIRRQNALLDDFIGAERRYYPPVDYPRLFSKLLQGHSFTAFTVGDVLICSNLRDEEDSLEQLFHDQALTRALCDAGFLQFGRPRTGAYDRVCFDVRGLTASRDAPVVVMDHEAILSHGRIPNPKRIADRFGELFRVAGLHA